jgi:hypothetical protein
LAPRDWGLFAPAGPRSATSVANNAGVAAAVGAANVSGEVDPDAPPEAEPPCAGTPLPMFTLPDPPE